MKVIFDGVIEGNWSIVRESVETALAKGETASAILGQGLIPAMLEVGRLMQTRELFVPEVMAAAKAMRAGMEVLRPHLGEGGVVESAGTVVLGTVQEDVHDLGKDLVGVMLEGTGFRVVDLGVGISPEQFLAAVRDVKPDILGMSALLTTTMDNMRLTIEALTEAGLRDKVKIMVGGAPVDAAFAEEIGADGYAPDAGSAVALARQLVGERG